MTNEVSNASGRERGHKEVHLKAKGKRKKNEHIARQWQQRKKKKIEKGKKVKGDTRRTNEKELAAIRKRESFPSCTAGVVESCVALLFSCSVRESPGESEEGEGKTRERWTPHVCVCVCVCACAAASLWPVSASVRPLLCLSLLLSSLAPHLPLHVGRHPLNRTQRVRTSFEKTILCVCVRSGLVRGVYLLKNQHECFPSPSYGALFRTVSARFLCGWFCLSHGGQTPALTSSFLCLLRTHRPHSCPSSVCEVDSGSLFTFLVADLIFPFFFWRLHVSHKQVWGFFSAVVYLLFLLLCKCSCVCVCVCVCA